MRKHGIILCLAILLGVIAGCYAAYSMLQFGKSMGATFITFKDVMGAYGAGTLMGGWIGLYTGLWINHKL
jgi:hypothetical protein